jgi:predicted Zn-dependent protease
MISTEKRVINETEGYLISFADRVQGTDMFAYIFWTPLDGKLFKLIGIGPASFRTDLENTAESLKVLNSQEKESFTVNLMRVVKASEGETIESLSKRTNNQLSPDLTRVLNSKSQGQILKEGDLIKVVKTYPFKVN